MSSLRQKITLGYTALAVLLVGLSIRSLLELHQIERQIETGGRIAELFDVTLEIRRFEKNFFLYHQQQDVRENATYLARARQLLDENRATFIELAPALRVGALRGQLDRYAAQMAAFVQNPHDAAASQAIRVLGLDIVNTAQTLASAERGVLQARLDQHRRALLLTLAALLVLLSVAAFLVWCGMVRPLQQMEERMEAIAAGSTDRLALASRHREMVSLVRASNHMLDELRLRQQQQLIQADRLASLGRLISGVAHEINNPLSNISSTAQILLEEPLGDIPGADPHWHHDMLKQIDDETTRAQGIVRSLLDYARKRDFEPGAIVLQPVIDDTLGFLHNDLSAQLVIECEITPGLQVLGDKPRLQQVFLNLLKNAIDAQHGAGVVSIRATADADDGVEIVFHDSGPGIPAEVLPHIFEPFYSTKEASKGSGMGLFIVHEIIEEHGGTIRAISPPGDGAHFYIHLPRPRT